MNDRALKEVSDITSNIIFLGIVLLVAGITCVPNEAFTRQVFYLFIALPAFSVFVKSFFGDRKGKLFVGSELGFGFLILFLLYAFSSLFWSDLDIVGRADVGRRFYYILLYALAVFMLTRDAALLNKLPYIFIALTSVSLVLAVAVWSEDVHRLEGVGRLRIETHAAGFYCSASVLSAYFALTTPRRTLFFFWCLCSLFLLFGNVLTVSRMPMLVNLLFLVGMLVWRFRSNIPALLASLVVIFALLAVVLVTLFPEKLDVIYEKGVQSLRYQIWARGYELFLQRPILGIGIGRTEVIQFGWGELRYNYHPHNLLLAYAIKLGIVGLVSLLFLISFALWRGIADKRLHTWVLMLLVYFLLSMASGRVVLDRIQPEWVLFYLPWFVLLSSKKRASGL